MALYRKCCFPNSAKVMANKVTFVGFRGGDRPIAPPLDSPLVSSEQEARSFHVCSQAVGIRGAARMRPKMPWNPEANLQRHVLVLCINFQLLQKHQGLTTSLSSPSRTKFLAALLVGMDTGRSIPRTMRD